MAITYQQIVKLLATVANTVPDQLDCDGCVALVAELAEVEGSGGALSDALQAVRVHLSQCSCCAYEYQALLEAIESADAPGSDF